MAEFKVDVPPDFEEERQRPVFAFRDADPVEVGEEKAPENEEAPSPRDSAFDTIIHASTMAHESLAKADKTLFELARFAVEKRGEEAPITAGQLETIQDMINGLRLAGALMISSMGFVGDLFEVVARNRNPDFQPHPEMAVAAVRMQEVLDETIERYGISRAHERSEEIKEALRNLERIAEEMQKRQDGGA